MSAARPLPEIQSNITINSSYVPDHQGIIVGHQDTISFYNGAPQDITIHFMSNSPGQPIYSQQDVLIPKGTSWAFTTPNFDCAANYTVNVGPLPQPGGPYAIQVGNGCMYVKVTNVYSSPDPIAIPIGGRIEFFSTDTSYQCNWPNAPTNGGPYSQALNTIAPSVISNTARQENVGIAQSYGYTIPTPPPGLGQGGGRVIVVSG